MTESEPEGANKLRNAAVEALQTAARQSDHNEFVRLTRRALGLVERARAARQGWKSLVRGTDGGPALRIKDEIGGKQGAQERHTFMTKFIATTRRR